jgi:hypothetical protein
MFHFGNRTVLFFVALVGFIFHSFDALAAEIILEADFNEGVANALSPRGVIPAFPPQKGEFRYAPGMVLNALAIQPGQTLSYKALGHIDTRQGTLSFWIQPVDWGNQHHQFVPIWCLGREAGEGWSYVLYYNNTGANYGLLSFRSYCDGKEYDITDEQSLKWHGKLAKGQWTHVVLTWNSQENKLYLDGKQVGRYYYGLTVTMPPPGDNDRLWFMPAAFWHNQCNHTTLLDEVKVYSTALNDDEVVSLYKKTSSAMAQQIRPSLLPVPKASTAITLDGKLAPGEWDDATKVPLSKRFFPQQEGALPAWVFLKYDNDCLYLGYDIPHDTNWTLPTEGRQVEFDHRTSIWSGDEAEFDCRRPGDNEEMGCQFAVAPNGTYAYRKDKDWRWKANFRFAVSKEANRWTAEMAIPFKDLGYHPGSDKPLEANFSLHRPRAEVLGGAFDRWLSWSSGGKGLQDTKSMGRLRFMPDATALRIHSLGELSYGRLNVQMEGRGGKPIRAALRVCSEDNQIAVDKKELALTAQPVTIEETLGWSKKQAVFSLQAFPAGEHEPVFDYSSLFYVRDPFDFQFARHDNVIEIQADLAGLIEKFGPNLAAGKIRVLATVEGPDGKVFGKTEGMPRSTSEKVVLPFQDPPVGRYTIRVTVCSGAEVWEKTQILERPSAQFLADRKGLNRSVPAPWTALRSEKGAVTLLQRKYEFGPGPFPKRAWSLGQEVLAGEPLLKVCVAGKTNVFQPLESKVTETADDRWLADGTAVCKEAQLRLRWKRRVDYDGLIRYDLTLVPLKGEVKVESLALEMPVPMAVARYALTPRVDATYNPVWTTDPKAVVSGFPEAWLTNETAGICLFTDTDANWVYPKDDRPIRLLRAGDHALIRAEIIMSPVLVRGEVPYVFGLIATPTKPLRKDFRAIHDGGWKAQKGQTLQVREGWEKEFWFECVWLFTRFLDPDKARASIKAYRSKGIGSMPYGCGNSMPDSNALYDYYAYQWDVLRDGRACPRTDRSRWEENGQEKYYSYATVCPNSGFADYMTYYTDQLMRDYDLVGLYLDFGSYTVCDSERHGCRRKDVFREGRIPISYNTFAIRAMFERLYKIIHHYKPDGFLYTHQWDAYSPGLHSFVDIVNPGEEFMHTAPTHPEVYMSETPLEKWQSVYRSQTLGSEVQFLGQCCNWTVPGVTALDKATLLKRSRPLLACCLLHDIPCSGGQYTEVESVWAILDRNHISQAEFAPYWQQKQITSNDPKVLVSHYSWKNDRRRLILLGNWDSKPKAITLRFTDLDPKQYSATDEETGAAANLTSPIPIPGYDFRILLIR